MIHIIYRYLVQNYSYIAMESAEDATENLDQYIIPITILITKHTQFVKDYTTYELEQKSQTKIKTVTIESLQKQINRLGWYIQSRILPLLDNISQSLIHADPKDTLMQFLIDFGFYRCHHGVVCTPTIIIRGEVARSYQQKIIKDLNILVKKVNTVMTHNYSHR